MNSPGHAKSPDKHNKKHSDRSRFRPSETLPTSMSERLRNLDRPAPVSHGSPPSDQVRRQNLGRRTPPQPPEGSNREGKKKADDGKKKQRRIDRQFHETFNNPGGGGSSRDPPPPPPSSGTGVTVGGRLSGGKVKKTGVVVAQKNQVVLPPQLANQLRKLMI